MRMKEVCQKTGLTEKAVRLYMKEGLVAPEQREGLHGTGYHFDEDDLARLRDVAALREAGFGLADIREMLTHPERIPALVEERSALLAGEIAEKRAVHQALERLSAAEQGSVRDAASALRPVAHAKKEAAAAAEKTTRRAAAVGKLLLLPLCLLTFYWVLGRPKPERFWQDFPIMVCVLCLILFLLFSVMGLRYLTCPLRARRYPCRGRGTVTEVVAETGFDAGFARIGAQMHGAAAEPGQGGFWQVWFMTWNELRPDHWFPVIHYTDENGQPRAASYPYGGLRGCWRPGQTLTIAWRPQDRGCVYPLDRAGWLAAKGLVYLAIGLGCAAGTAASWVWWWNSMAPYLT